MMVEVEEAWRLIDRHAGALPARAIPLAEARGATLAETVVADADHPPFDRATMDGYAIREDDPADAFWVVDTVWPGESRERKLGPGQAWRILTGAAVPGPGLRVVMQEDTEREGDRLRVLRRGEGTNVCRRGEDVRAGAVLVTEGTRLGAAELALLASVGATSPRVVRPPRVLHFTSGDEIVPPDETPGAGKIRNTNATLVRALAAAFPVEAFAHRHLPDEASQAGEIIAAADPDAFDVVLFSGGASVGDHDFTRGYLEALGYDVRCAQVNVRPGKPLLFASREGKVAFGLPGNPLSHFVCFHLFVARALSRLAGRAAAAPAEAELAAAIPGVPNRRVTFWPARLDRNTRVARVTPVPWNSSGHLAALAGVDALIRLGANAGLPKPGATVHIIRTDAP